MSRKFISIQQWANNYMVENCFIEKHRVDEVSTKMWSEYVGSPEILYPMAHLLVENYPGNGEAMSRLGIAAKIYQLDSLDILARLMVNGLNSDVEGIILSRQSSNVVDSDATYLRLAATGAARRVIMQYTNGNKTLLPSDWFKISAGKTGAEYILEHNDNNWRSQSAYTVRDLEREAQELKSTCIQLLR